jgi:hypothetical protein
LLQKRKLINVFLILLVLHFIASLALGAYSIYVTYTKSSEEVQDECERRVQGDDNIVEHACSTGVKIGKGLVVAMYAVTWVIEFCKSSSPAWSFEQTLIWLFVQMPHSSCTAIAKS